MTKRERKYHRFRRACRFLGFRSFKTTKQEMDRFYEGAAFLIPKGVTLLPDGKP